MSDPVSSVASSVANNYYVQHYFNPANAGKYLIAAIAGLIAVMAVMLLAARRQRTAAERSIRRDFADAERRRNSRRGYRQSGGEDDRIDTDERMSAQPDRYVQSGYVRSDSRFGYERQGGYDGRRPQAGFQNYGASGVREGDTVDAELEIRRRRRAARRKGVGIIESFYELVFSSTSILLFLSLYNIVDWHMPQIWAVWDKYKDIILVVFLMFSVLFANFLDRFLVRLPHLSDEEKGSLRLVSNMYIILIMMYIKFIYEDANYDSMIIYFISLSLGRFIYFDFSWKDFRGTCGGILSKLPVMGLLLIYSAFLCWYGFHVDFLLTSNGVLVSTLIAHLFMDVSIFILEKTHLLQLFL